MKKEEPVVIKIYREMLEYQKIHNIKGKDEINTYILNSFFNLLEDDGSDINHRVVVGIMSDGDKHIVHSWIELYINKIGIALNPTYDNMNMKDNIEYFNSINTFLTKHGNKLNLNQKKELIENLIKYNKYLEMITFMIDEVGTDKDEYMIDMAKYLRDKGLVKIDTINNKNENPTDRINRVTNKLCSIIDTEELQYSF